MQLYPAASPDYTKNGITLHASKAEVTYQDGGRWELDVTLPIVTGEHKLIGYGMHIKASVPPYTIPEIDMGTVSYWKIPDGSAAVPLYKSVTQPVSYAEWDWTGNYSVGSKATCAGWGNYQCTQYDGGSPYIQVPPYNSDWWTKIPDKIPGQVITQLAAGTQLTKLNDYNSTYMMVSTLSGQKGYIEKSKCAQVGGGASYIIPEKHITEQPFEVRQIRKDQSGINVVIHCVHDSYDLGGVLLGGCSMENATPQTALEFISGAMQRAYGGELITNIDEGTVTADWSWKNAQSALLDPKSGFLKAVNGYAYRDGKNIYIVPETDEGIPSYQVIYGANMKTVLWTGDIDALVTRVYPVAQNADGGTLMLPEMYIETVKDLPMIREAMIKVNAKVGQKIEQADGSSVTLTESDVLQQMRDEANACFAVDHCDEPVIKLELDYEHMPDTAEYAQYQSIKNAEPHAWLLVRHGPLDIDAVIRMTGYQWDALLNKYLKTSYGAQSTGTTVASYQLGNGAVTARSLASGSVGGDALRAKSIEAQHIQTRTLTAAQIAAKALTAEVIASKTITAEELAANSVTAEKIAALAITAEKIAALAITAEKIAALAVTADKIAANSVTAEKIAALAVTADKIAANSVTAEKIAAGDVAAINAKLGTATVVNGYIDNAVIEYARIKAATAESLIARDAVTDRYFIDKLAVRNAQMVQATVGELVIKASDNKYYRLDVAANGSVSPTEVTLTAAEIAAGQTQDGHAAVIETDLTVADLSASSMKAVNALIDKLTASRIDVSELFARTATINQLNAWDIRGNSYLRLAVNRTYSQMADPVLDPSNNVQDGDVWNRGRYTWADFAGVAWAEADVAWTGYETGEHYVRENGAWVQKYTVISGIDIVSAGVEISGQKYVRIKSGGSFVVDSGNFSIDSSGNVRMSGTVEASAGEIGGWAITAALLSSGSGAGHVALSSDPSGIYSIWAGNETAASAPFSVKRNGEIKATSGTIGGWNIGANKLSSGTGTNYVEMATSGDYAFAAGDSTAGNAPFRVKRDGTVYLTKLIALDQNGQESTVNLRTAGLWKLDTANIKNASVSGNTLTIERYFGGNLSLNFNSAASVTLSGSWSGAVYTVTASNGETNSVELTPSPAQTGQTGTPLSAFNAQHKMAITVSTPGIPNAPLFMWTIDASGEYAAGQNSVSVTKGSWNGGIISFTPSAGSGLGKSVQLSQGTVTWNGNTATFPIMDGQGSTGYTCSVDASARYTAGQNSVSVTKGSWSGGQIAFATSAGSGAGKTVQLSQGTVTWNGNTATFPVMDGQGSTGYTCTVDAQARYNAGYAAGWAAAKALIALDNNVIKGPPDTVDGAAVDLYTVTCDGWINSIVNNAPGYYTAQGGAYAYVNGDAVSGDSFSKTVQFS